MAGMDDAFQKFINRWANHALLSKEDEYDLIRKAQEDLRKDRQATTEWKIRLKTDPTEKPPRLKKSQALEALTRANVRLLLSAAQNYRRMGQARGLFLEDLFNIAAMGLSRAIEKFDLTLNLRLTTYSGWWVRQSLVRSMHDLGSTIRLPVHVAEQRRRMLRLSGYYQSEYGGIPDEHTLSRITGLSVRRVMQVMDAPSEPSSLDRPAHGHDGAADAHLSLAELATYPDAQDQNPEADLGRAERRSRIEDAKMLHLNDMERQILDCRFERDMTLTETAEYLAKPGREPLSRERIRQIEAVALKKLRKPLS